MCNSTATTREHVPPLSFFPSGKKDNLITVPSCEMHNNSNSKDVEYIRNIITTSFNVNAEGLAHYHNKTKRSFKRSEKLTQATFQNVITVDLGGVKSKGFNYSVERFDKVFDVIGRGLFFYDFGKKFTGEWLVVNVNAYMNWKHLGNPSYEPYEKLFDAISNNSMDDMPVGNPEIFRYLRIIQQEIYIYLLVLYEGFEVLLVS